MYVLLMLTGYRHRYSKGQNKILWKNYIFFDEIFIGWGKVHFYPKYKNIYNMQYFGFFCFQIDKKILVIDYLVEYQQCNRGILMT